MNNEASFYWAKASVPMGHDIALLRPASLPRGKRFETPDDAAQYSQALESLLRRTKGGHDSAEFLNDCREGHYTCGKPFCPLCARQFRRWLFGQTSQIFSHEDKPHRVLNLHFGAWKAGDLGSANPDRIRDRLRKQSNRAGLGEVVAVGGIEAALKDGHWLVHGHVAVAGAGKDKRDRLRAYFDGAGSKRPFVDQEMRDPAKQLSYVLKFHSYQRPAKGGQAYPLKRNAALELVRWQNGRSFEDFLFLKGLRRRGVRIEPR